MTIRYDAQGRTQALVAWDPSQERAPAGAANGGQWVSDSSDQSASQDDAEAKRMYADLLNLPPEQRAAYLAKLNPDQLTRLGKFASIGKEAKGPIADIKSAVGNAMSSRGLNPGTAGLKAKAGAKKKPAAKKGGSGKSGGSKGGGGGKSSGGGKKSSGGSKSSGSKSGGSKSSSSKGSSKTPAKTPAAPKPAKPTPPPPPEVKPISGRPGSPNLPGGPGGGPPTVQTSRPARRLGKRRRPGGR